MTTPKRLENQIWKMEVCGNLNKVTGTGGRDVWEWGDKMTAALWGVKRPLLVVVVFWPQATKVGHFPMFPGVEDKTGEKKDEFFAGERGWNYVSVVWELGWRQNWVLWAVWLVLLTRERLHGGIWGSVISQNLFSLRCFVFFLFALFFSPVSFKQDIGWIKRLRMHRAGSMLTWGRFRYL